MHRSCSPAHTASDHLSTSGAALRRKYHRPLLFAGTKHTDAVRTPARIRGCFEPALSALDCCNMRSPGPCIPPSYVRKSATRPRSPPHARHKTYDVRRYQLILVRTAAQIADRRPQDISGQHFASMGSFHRHHNPRPAPQGGMRKPDVTCSIAVMTGPSAGGHGPHAADGTCYRCMRLGKCDENSTKTGRHQGAGTESTVRARSLRIERRQRTAV